MHLETLFSTANREGGLAKNIGIAARLLKKMCACGFCDAILSIIKFN
jgi:hypothetical protein